MYHFESLIDPTDFGFVRREMNCSSSPITDVLFVRDDNLLASVAELLSDPHATEAQRAQFARWINEGLLRVGVRRTQLASQSNHECRVDIDAISDDARCRVLFLPPYFLVHLRSPAGYFELLQDNPVSRD